MIRTFKLSGKNQATVPKWVRQRIHVSAHHDIEYHPLGKRSVVITAAKSPDYSHIFDQPGLTRKNYQKFMKSINENSNNKLIGKERW